MSNTYYNPGAPIARFITADATRINQELSAIKAGFDKLPSATELNQGSRAYSVATGVANTYAVTLPYAVAQYTTGMRMMVFIPPANTGPATIAVNGLAAVQIRRFDGTVLSPGDLRALSINDMTFDGVNFRLTSVHGAAEQLATTSATNASASASQSSVSASQAAASALSASNSASTASAAADNATGVLAGTAFGLRNVLLNPLWWYAQRLGAIGAGVNYTVAAGTYFRDRWKAGAAGLTFNLSAGTLNIIAGSAQQIVQGRNLPFTNNYTLSWFGTAAGSINGTSVANGGHIMLSGYQHATVEFTGGTLYRPQLEFGSSKTTPELRPMDLERILCQQYYQKSYSDLVVPGTVTTDGAVHGIAISALLLGNPTIQFQVPMRATPAILLWNPALLNTSNSIHNTDDGNPYSYSIEHISDRSFVYFRNLHDFTPGHRFFFHWVADAEL
jgi:hypothetical protein